MVFKFNDSLSFNDFLQYLPKNEHGLSPDMLENTLSSLQRIDTRKTPKTGNAQYYWIFAQNKNHLSTKILLSIDGICFGKDTAY